MEISKTKFRVAYEKSHDLLNDALEMLDKLYGEKDFEIRRQLLTKVRDNMKQVSKNFNGLAAGEDDGSGY